jgi:putative aldouronate transport system substrate-binding protein
MKKRVLTAVLAAAMLASLFGCGDSGGGGATTAAPADATTAAGAAATTEAAGAAEQGETPATSEAAATTAQAEAPAATEAAGSGEPGQIVDGVYRYNEPVKLTALLAVMDVMPDPENCWLYEYAEQAMNIDIDFVTYPNDQVSEVADLLMASGDYPEAILYFEYAFSGLMDMVKFGDQEKQMVPLNKYLTDPSVMPNLSKIMAEFEDQLPTIMTPSGNIYTVPSVMQEAQYTVNMSDMPLWYDQRVMDALGAQPPKTADELLDYLRLVKAEDPKGLGSDNIPIGTSLDSGNNLFGASLLAAHGFVSGGMYSPFTLKGGAYAGGDGQIAPLQTDPVFFELLKLYRAMYSEGLMDAEFFTRGSDELAAMAQADRFSVFLAYNVLGLGDDSYQSYYLLPPMTSQYSDKQIVPFGASQLGLPYQFYLTDKASEEQSVALMRFADRCYDEKFRYNAYYGPEAGVDDGYGLLEGWYKDADGAFQYRDVDSGKFPDVRSYYYSVGPIRTTGNILDRRTDGAEVASYKMDDRVGRTNLETINKLNPFLVRGLPYEVYGEDVATMMDDTSTALEEYIRTELARFVVGDRELTEAGFAAYGDELRAIGYDDYVRTYTDTMNSRFGK